MRYPLGIQDFRTLREGGYVYVDKTEQIIGCLDAGAALFLSRPRRFGKSLTVATLNELYSGDRELFRGLWAYDHWDFAAMRRPVIWLKFASAGFKTMGVEGALRKLLRDEAVRLGCSLDERTRPPTNSSGSSIEQVARMSPRGNCVVSVGRVRQAHRRLPSTTLRSAERHRDLMKTFFGVVKDQGPYIEKVFLTGVSAFSKVSIFSDLNHIVNLTLHWRAQVLVGWTQGELEQTFASELANTNVAPEVIRRWYNGYSWAGEKVYNPWSVMSFLEQRQLQNFWYSTGTPTWLVGLVRNGWTYDLAGVTAAADTLLDFRLDTIKPIGVLFQTGYLTISVVDREPDMPPVYTLDYPNLEVSRELLRQSRRGLHGPARALRLVTHRAVDQRLPSKRPRRRLRDGHRRVRERPVDFWRRDASRSFTRSCSCCSVLRGSACGRRCTPRRGAAMR